MDILKSVLSAPTQVGLEVTHRCNLYCDFCLLDCGPTGTHMSVERIKKTIDMLYETGVFSVILTGGEPLLINNFEELIDHMGDYGDSIEFSLNTNGILLNEKLISHLANKMGKTFKLNFGMEGYDEKTYGMSRGNPHAWSKIIENVKLSNDHGLKAGFMYCLTKRTLPFVLRSLNHYFEDLKMNSGAVLFFMPIGRGRKNVSKLQFSLEDLARFFKMIDSLRESVPWLKEKMVWGIYARWRVYLSYIQAGVDYGDLKDEVARKWGYYPISDAYGTCFGTASCHAGITDVVIEPNGNVRPCFMMRGKHFVIGNIFTNSLEKIWTGSPMLKTLRSLNVNMIGAPCNTCNINTLCCATCRACAYEFTGDIYAPDPNCPVVTGEVVLGKT